MAIPQQVEEQFFAARRSSAVPFVINDAVQVVAGLFAGRTASVVSIAAVHPDLVLVVELDDGSDARLVATDIKLIDDAG